MKKLLALSPFLILLAGCSGLVGEPNAVPAGTPDAGSGFVLAETSFDFGTVLQSGGVVSHDFPFVWRGETPLRITGTPGSCACTTASTDRETYQPGDSGVLTVRFDPNLHAEPEGKFFKTVSVLSDPEITPMPEVRIWARIDLDLGPSAYKLQEPDHDDDHAEAK